VGGTALACELSVSVHHRSAWPSIAPVWSELAAASPNCSVFLTEAWIGTWLEVYGPDLDPSILVFGSAGEAVGACLLVRTSQNQALLQVNRISLNASGEAAAETTYIEFNDLLCRAGWEERVAEAAARHILQQEWDELALDGFCNGRCYEVFQRVFGGLDSQEVWKPSYFVDLAAIRRSGIEYEMALSGSTRWQLRRKTRHFEAIGPLRLEEAQDPAAALTMLDELAGLNRSRWAAREGTAFVSPRCVEFHRELIRRRFPQRGVQLLRLTAGPQIVGLMYNLVHRGKVYFYQAGFQYSGDRRVSPGTVSFSQAIRHCLSQGFDDYDFLAGEARYKRSLSTGSRSLVWAVFRKPTLKLRTLNRLRRIHRRLRGVRS
jgi:CelD/BcsL family acetyltransferase involved in cellulose biosynthesis